MITPEVVRRLAPEHRPNSWTGSFAEVLPFWREALSRTIEDFHDELKIDGAARLTEIGKALFETVTNLAEPDPALRGDPTNRVGQQDRLSMQKYISLFNRLKQTAAH